MNVVVEARPVAIGNVRLGGMPQLPLGKQQVHPRVVEEERRIAGRSRRRHHAAYPTVRRVVERLFRSILRG
jgi:hypothetical protein